MRQTKAGRYPGRGADSPVDPGRDHPVHALGLGQPLERRLVVERDDRPPIGVAKARRRGVAIDRDHEDASRTRRSQQAELPRARP